MNPAAIIARKRDGFELSPEELTFFIRNYVNDSIADYQMSALLMAIYLNGMTFAETRLLTELMLNSGDVADLKHLPMRKVDKHSTGGVGDKLSLIIAPIVAAAGVAVPMISGRGLGHTGGTLDKLQSIPGFRIDYDMAAFARLIEENNICLIGQTPQIAPADRKMYALRDVTATVSSIPLITASIMSKKLAEDIDGLILDVKVGSGAFMKSLEEAEELAQNLARVGGLFNKNVSGIITNMDQPLGYAIGNRLEVIESLQCLRGDWVPDLKELALALAGMMIHSGGAGPTIAAAIEMADTLVQNGSALKKFEQVVAAQNGDLGAFFRQAEATTIVKVLAPNSGIIHHIDALETAGVALELGAGRRRVTDKIDPTAGVKLLRKPGASVNRGDVLAELHSSRSVDFDNLAGMMTKAIAIGQEKKPAKPLILRYFTTTELGDWKIKIN
jgi:pyrimidine-nucleoside phosphorylase